MSRSCRARWVRRRVPAVDDERLRVVAHARMQHQQQLTRRPVGAMDSETPAAQIRFGANCGAMTPNDRLIVIPPGLSTAGSDAAGAFGLNEFDAAGIRKAFFGGIDDLDDMAMRAGRRKLGNCAPDLVNR